ncbi:MAG: glycerol kinase, partial [Acidimicrobiaceae bacterium]|nr:glycerol kinase [Acidimicrobiaceae bacterium]
MAAVIAIDAGTTGVRALAVDDSGRVVASAYEEFAQYYPQPGWVEHDAGEIWASVSKTVGAVADELREAGRAISAIGITNQRETAILWDR